MRESVDSTKHGEGRYQNRGALGRTETYGGRDSEGDCFARAWRGIGVLIQGFSRPEAFVMSSNAARADDRKRVTEESFIGQSRNRAHRPGNKIPGAYLD